MRQQSTETVDKAVCTEEGGAARLEAVLLALVERKARALHAEQSRRRRLHPLLLLLRDGAPDEEASIVGSPGAVLPSHWCEHERQKHRNITLHTHGDLSSPEQLEMERRRRRRRRRRRSPRDSKPRKHRTLLVSAIDEQAKVIHVLDPDELPRRARYTIMVTACLLLFLCLLLVGVTLRMAPLIDDMVYCATWGGRQAGGAPFGRLQPRDPPAMSVRVDHRDRERFSRHSSRASVDLAYPSGSSRDHSFRSVHSARVPRVASDDLMVPVRPLRSASCRVAPGAPHRLRRHHSSAAECERARRSRRHTLELPGQRAASVRSRSPEPPPPPEPELPPEEASKEARRRRVVTAVAASFFALALASVLVVVVTLTHSSVLRAHNQTAKYYTFSVPPHHPLSEPRSCCPTVAPPASHATVSEPECPGLRTSAGHGLLGPDVVYTSTVL